MARSVEQLCALSPDAPSIEHLRPQFCTFCGAAQRRPGGGLQLVGHGLYGRQVRGLCERTWIVIRVRRFRCRRCGHTISRLPDWLHPWRWYAATVIIEALCRHCWFHESSRSIGARFGRPEHASEWASVFRWRAQLLISPTLWGWLGLRLGVRQPAANRQQGHLYLERFLAEAGQRLGGSVEWLNELAHSVRRTLCDLVHNRKIAGSLRQFPPGPRSLSSPGPTHNAGSTEKDSGPDPPR